MLVIPLLHGLTRILGIPWWKRCGVRTLADRRGIRLLSVNRCIGMSSRGSQLMFYQGKFKSLHEVKRSGKTKIWIPLERRTWEELQELDGDSIEVPWESAFHPISSLIPCWSLRNPWGEGEEIFGGRSFHHGLEEEESWWIMEEREDEGVKK
jgi:hypothetical protein